MTVTSSSTSSSTSSPARAVAEGYMEALLSGGDFEQYFSDDVAFEMVGAGITTRGRNEVGAFIRAAHFEMFDGTVEFTSLVVDDRGTGFALEAVFVARHIGEFAGIPATGREVRIPYSVHYDLTDGEISALRIHALAQALVSALTS